MPQLFPTTIVRNIVFAGGSKGHFNEDDFKIKKFGIRTDGNPFLTVEGKAEEINTAERRYWACLCICNK